MTSRFPREPTLIENKIYGFKDKLYDLGPLEEIDPSYRGVTEFQGCHAVGVMQDGQMVIDPFFIYRPDKKT